jgi:hypothetical protein
VIADQFRATPNDQYCAAVNAIAAMTNLDPDDIEIALGDEGNIWPASIQADALTR